MERPILIILLIVFITLYINKNAKNKELLKALKRVNKDLNNEKNKLLELERRHEASLMMNLVPVSFSNYMIEFCQNSQFIDKCPIDDVDITYIQKFQNLFYHKQYDEVMRIIDKYGLNFHSRFKEIIDVFKEELF